ncbi:MAG TPA: hypothetical protein VLL77_05275 [Anaerolineales bacterium]|nr:hypothetical protein [Anaerolineales bacterium]
MTRSLAGLTLAILGLVFASSAWADSALPAASPAPAPAAAAAVIDNETCLGCHAAPGQTKTLPSGEPIYISIDPEVFTASIHGREGLQCIGCHAGHDTFPHPAVTAQTRREYNLDRYTVCADCHADKYEASLDSVHQKALAGGNQEAAICTDCHGPHSNVDLDAEPRVAIPQTCEKCHSAIYQAYRESVHGSALTEENPDVPTCIDCHGVHDVHGPSNSPFHLFSPTICLECHADPELMAKYGLSTEIRETYVADFHGTTVLLFEKLAPDQETNKPVCIDCHGVHDILAPNDPNSRVMQENLLNTCQRCHPDATVNFPAAWLGHYAPDPIHTPLVYYVGLFYQILIPVVIGGMAFFVATDLVRTILNRRREARHG